MKLHSLQLTNFRCFESLTVEFDQQLTVLVANNGMGKTAVLDAIAIAFGPFVGAFDVAEGKHFKPNDIRMIRARETATNEMEYAKGGVELEAYGYIPLENGWNSSKPDPNWHTWHRRLTSPIKSRSTKEAEPLVAYGKKLQNQVRTPNSARVLPVLAYYGTGRLWQQKKLTSSKLDRTSRTVAYADCLDPASSYKIFASWFRYWSTNSWKAKIEAAQLGGSGMPTEFDNYIESVTKAVNQCLAISGWGNIDYSMAREEIIAVHPEYGQMPLSLLSDGIRNMIGMVADIAFRTTKLNPNLGPFASDNTPGIVLIDEVDMHLHPAWQQAVLPSLNAAFPEIQFIVTTHSPQVISTVPSHCIRVIDNGQVYSAPPGTEGAEASRVLKRVFGVDVRPPSNEATKELKEYLALVDAEQWDSLRAKELRQKLDARYQGEEPALLEADLHIENRKWELGL